MISDISEIAAKYKLSHDEHKKIEKEIINIFLYNKYPVEKPKAIINLAPSGSGKTGLNSFGNNQFSDNNVIIINGDELRAFHPKMDEIVHLYPDHFAKITDQESSFWTSSLFDMVLAKGYNVIFEGTGRNTYVLDIIQEKMQNYFVVVRGMAVSDLTCLMSILERYEYQVMAKGWGRISPLDHFYLTYDAMPKTISNIESSHVANSVEIYKRGVVPSKPIKIYDSLDSKLNSSSTAKEAILQGRIEDRKNADKHFETYFIKFINNLNNKNMTDEEHLILSKILELAPHINELEI